MNKIRFSAVRDSKLIVQTEWASETDRTSAPNLLEGFRKQYPDCAYLIERTGDSKVPNLRQVTRVVIQDGKDVYYSRWFEAREVDEQFAAIREKWPRSNFTTEVKEV